MRGVIERAVGPFPERLVLAVILVDAVLSQDRRSSWVTPPAMPLDARLTEMLGLAAGAPAVDIARRVARLAELRPPTQPETIDFVTRSVANFEELLDAGLFDETKPSGTLVEAVADSVAFSTHPIDELDPAVQMFYATDLGILEWVLADSESLLGSRLRRGLESPESLLGWVLLEFSDTMEMTLATTIGYAYTLWVHGESPEKPPAHPPAFHRVRKRR